MRLSLPLFTRAVACICWCAFYCFNSAYAEDDSPPYTEDRVCAEVQRLLNVPSQGREILNALGMVFGSAQDRSHADVAAEKFEDLDRFAQTLLRGSEPRLLETQILESTNVENRFTAFQPPRWRVGDWGQRGRLGRRLWDRAKSLQNTDQNSASRLAKAAIVLGAQDQFNPVPLVVFLRDAQCGALTGANPDSLRRLADQIVPSKDAGAAGLDRRAAVAEPLNRCIELDRAKQPYENDAAQVLSAFRRAWPLARSRDEAWRLANLLWRFTCLSRANHDETSLKAITSLVDELATSTRDNYAKRWLQEVLTVPGDRPKNSGVNVIRDPNQMKPSKGP